MSNTSSERRMLARVEELEDTSDLAEKVIAILAGARRARLDPSALGGLVGAAFALGADQLRVYTAGDNGEQEITTERQFAEFVAAAEDDIEERLEEAKRLERDVRSARRDARRDLAEARRDLSRARNLGTSNPCDGCHDAKAAAIADAQDRIRDAADRIDCCDAALDILGPLIRRLEHALRCIRRVPSDLGEAYESVYNLLRRSRVLPHDGDFITGHDRVRALDAARAHAAEYLGG